MKRRFKDFLYETSLSRVMTHTQNRNIGQITASRGEFSHHENHDRNKALEHDLRSKGYGFIRAKGRYVEGYGSDHARPVDEHSYIVVGQHGDDNGRLKGDLKELGQKYGQDSVLHKDSASKAANLIGTSKRENSFPGYGKTHGVGTFHPNRAGEFHTILKHHSFAFEEKDLPGEVIFESPISYFNRSGSIMSMEEVAKICGIEPDPTDLTA